MIYSFDTEIAQKYGDRAAYFLGYLQHNITTNKAEKRNSHNGRTWSYNSISALHKIYSWLTERQIRTMIDNLVNKGIIKKCNAYEDLKVSGVNPKTNAYAFVNESEWINIKENPSDEKVKRNEESLDFKVKPSDEKVKPSDLEVEPINNYLPLITIKRESTLTPEIAEAIQLLWIKTWGRNPKLPEQEETLKLCKRFKFDTVESLFRESALMNFRNFKNFLDSITSEGKIKSLEEKKKEVNNNMEVRSCVVCGAVAKIKYNGKDFCSNEHRDKYQEIYEENGFNPPTKEQLREVA